MPETMSPKVMPQSLDAEISILGAMLLDNSVVDTVTEVLTSDDFYSQQNKWVYEAIVSLSNIGKPVDSLTLSEELKKEGIFDKIGGYSYITKIGDSVFSTTNVEHYCSIVKQKSTKRLLIKMLGDIVSSCYEDREEASAIIEQAQKVVYDIAMSKTKNDFVSLSQSMNEAIKELNAIYKSTEKLTGIPTDYDELDAITGGFQRSDFILIAARPSMGKTALAVNIAQNAAIRNDKTVALFSLEMSALQLTNRIIASEAEVDSTKIRSGNPSVGDWKKITGTFNNITSKDVRLFIDDTSGISVENLRSKCRKLKATRGLDMIIIDYLQLMTINDKTDNRQQEISSISRNLKAIAKEMDCPVVALSQLSRAPEARTNKRPMLSDLRESGAIEQDADVVLLLYRDKYYDQESEDDSTEVIIAKHRNGQTGTVKLTFHGEYTKFTPEIPDFSENNYEYE